MILRKPQFRFGVFLCLLLVCLLGVFTLGGRAAKPPVEHDVANPGKPGYVLADAGGTSGLWVQQPGAKTCATLYAQRLGDSDSVALGFYRDTTKAKTGCDFAVGCSANGIVLQIRDDAGKLHLLPVTALLKLEGEQGCKCKDVPAPMPRPAQSAAPKPEGRAGPSVTFEEALRDQIEGRPETIRSRRILAVLDMEPSARRDRILARMERHAAAELEIKGEAGKIDWSAIDWGKVFDTLMKILSAILPYLLLADAGINPLDLLFALLGWSPFGVG